MGIKTVNTKRIRKPLKKANPTIREGLELVDPKEIYPNFVPFTPFVSKKIIVRDTKTVKGKGVFAIKEIKKGELILEFEPTFIKKATQHTFRFDRHLHQLCMDEKAAENYLNHSCEANARFDSSKAASLRFAFRAKRKIKAGEEITYNYFTTDWGGEDNFECACGSLHCKRLITGFKTLTLSEKEALRSDLIPYLLNKLKQAKKIARRGN
jgi:hypothetical protein